MKNIIGKIVLALGIWSCMATAAAETTYWQEPCIPAPYDYSYQDDARAISINHVLTNGLSYWVADVQIQDAATMKTVLSDGSTVSAMAQDTDAVLAINGDDYGTHSYGVILRNGELLRAHDTTRHMLIVDSDGNMRLVRDRKANPYKALAEQLQSEQVWQAFEFGPALVENGQALSFPDAFDVISTRPSRKEPRTAIGMIEPLHYVIIVVDGRQPGYSDGISLQDLQLLFQDYGAQVAFNLDGGSSAEMWFMGEIISNPSGGQERRISDIICF